MCTSSYLNRFDKDIFDKIELAFSTQFRSMTAGGHDFPEHLQLLFSRNNTLPRTVDLCSDDETEEGEIIANRHASDDEVEIVSDYVVPVRPEEKYIIKKESLQKTTRCIETLKNENNNNQINENEPICIDLSSDEEVENPPKKSRFSTTPLSENYINIGSSQKSDLKPWFQDKNVEEGVLFYRRQKPEIIERSTPSPNIPNYTPTINYNTEVVASGSLSSFKDPTVITANPTVNQINGTTQFVESNGLSTLGDPTHVYRNASSYPSINKNLNTPQVNSMPSTNLNQNGTPYSAINNNLNIPQVNSMPQRHLRMNDPRVAKIMNAVKKTPYMYLIANQNGAPNSNSGHQVHTHASVVDSNIVDKTVVNTNVVNTEVLGNALEIDQSENVNTVITVPKNYGEYKLQKKMQEEANKRRIEENAKAKNSNIINKTKIEIEEANNKDKDTEKPNKSKNAADSNITNQKKVDFKESHTKSKETEKINKSKDANITNKKKVAPTQESSNNKPNDRRSFEDSSIKNKTKVGTAILSLLEPHKQDIEQILKQSSRADDTARVAATMESIIEAQETDHALPESMTRASRVLKELECTMLGYDDPLKNLYAHNGKRTSSIQARSTIARQLEELTSSSIPKRARSMSSRYEEYIGNHSFEPIGETFNIDGIKFSPCSVRLERLSDDIVSREMKKLLNNEQELLHTELVVGMVKLPCDGKKPTKVSKKGTKVMNTDINMTEKNTKTCILCKSKSKNLTPHFVRVHECESYVSRLSAEELNNLSENIPYAVPVNKTKHDTIYEVECGFNCNEKLRLPFNELFDHYAKHTGEFAYQCTNCHIQFAEKSEKMRHRKTSKLCKGKKFRTLYLYPDKLKTIYGHCCKLCNFVQLNEANTFKHLRDQHFKVSDDASYIEKVILCTIDDEVALNSNQTETLETDCVRQTSDVLVHNEPLFEHEEELTLDIKPSVDNFVSIPVADKGSSSDANDIIHLDQHQPMIVKSEGTLYATFRARSVYKFYETSNSCYGLYKCMAVDCNFTTDVDYDMITHLNEHLSSFIPAANVLECAYCVTFENKFTTPELLVSHVATQHQNSRYQCPKCVYRSCLADNVLVHFQLNHAKNQETCKVIYKCKGSDIDVVQHKIYMMEAMMRNVQPLQCICKFFC